MNAEYSRFQILYFGVRRSIRYHDHQERTYDMLHTWGRFITLVLSGTAFAALMKDHATLGQWCAVVAAMVSAAELAMGFSRKARLHNGLKRRFCDLEVALCPLLDTTPAATVIGDLECKRLMIEADEPPVKRVLNVLCHNELAVADNRLHDVYRVSLIYRWLAPYCMFANWDPGEPITIRQ
jgi:hypothetical protein